MKNLLFVYSLFPLTVKVLIFFEKILCRVQKGGLFHPKQPAFAVILFYSASERWIQIWVP